MRIATIIGRFREEQGQDYEPNVGHDDHNPRGSAPAVVQSGKPSDERGKSKAAELKCGENSCCRGSLMQEEGVGNNLRPIGLRRCIKDGGEDAGSNELGEVGSQSGPNRQRSGPKCGD